MCFSSIWLSPVLKEPEQIAFCENLKDDMIDTPIVCGKLTFKIFFIFLNFQEILINAYT